MLEMQSQPLTGTSTEQHPDHDVYYRCLAFPTCSVRKHLQLYRLYRVSAIHSEPTKYQAYESSYS